MATKITKSELKQMIREALREELYNNKSNLTEAKADIQRLVDFAGEDLANRFLAIKDKLKAPQNDLYYWIKNHTVEEFEQAVITAENTKSNRQQARDIAECGAELVGENGIYKVYHITSYEAAKKYGANTRWCITGINNYGRRYWDEYTEGYGVEFYFFLPKPAAEVARNLALARTHSTDPATSGLYLRDVDVDPAAKVMPSMLSFVKYALAVYPNGGYEIFDAMDNQVNAIPSAPYNRDLKASNIPDYDVAMIYCPNCGKMWYFNEHMDNTACPNCGMEVGYCGMCDYYCACNPNEEFLCSECRSTQ